MSYTGCKSFVKSEFHHTATLEKDTRQETLTESKSNSTTTTK